jgi:RecJ-like exonuclease
MSDSSNNQSSNAEILKLDEEGDEKETVDVEAYVNHTEAFKRFTKGKEILDAIMNSTYDNGYVWRRLISLFVEISNAYYYLL